MASSETNGGELIGVVEDARSKGQASSSGQGISEVSPANPPSDPTKKGTEVRVLLVEDDLADVELVLHALRGGGFEPESDIAQTVPDFLERVHKKTYDVVLADYNLPTWNGMETVELLRREGIDLPVVLVSGALGELKAVECIKRGAADYVLKDHLARLCEAVRRALREKKLRDERRQFQEELARSNRDLEQFAYVASHDLQEPLRMVATYTQLLAERYQGKLDENADKYIHYAVDGALRMQTLVQDLLAFSRAGRQGTDFKRVECTALLKTVCENLKTAILESGAQIEYGQLPTVWADGSQMGQVFQNLIGNAIKFHGPAKPLIRIAAVKKDREWIFSVADNGIGIAPQHAEIIFVIFKRLHTRAEYPGSGIGLAICQKILERHGGRIWVESKPGEGSTFKFALPVRGPRGRYDSCDEKRS